MKESNYYKAKEGYTYERKIDSFIMGNELYLGKFIDGTDDVIENYKGVIDDSPKEKDFNRLDYLYNKNDKNNKETTT